MFGYQPTQFNYGTYGSANGQQQNFIAYGQQQQQQQQGVTTPGPTATTNAYANPSQYSLAASAYAQYSQAATQQQQQQTAGVGYGIQPPPPPVDYTGTTASAGGTYGVIGGGKTGSAAAHKNPAASATAHGTNAGGGTHYAGYEAAVYAAASSYLQGKTHGNTGNWMNKQHGGSGGGGGGGVGGGPEYRKKRYGLGHQARDVQQFFCEVCKISCAGQAAYKDHLEGKPHKKKELAAKHKSGGGGNTYRGFVGFRCEVCEMTASSKDTYDAHVKGQKHQRTVALLKRMGKPVPEMDVSAMVSANNEQLGQPIPTVGSAPLKKVVGVTGTKFVGGTTLTSTGEEMMKAGGALNAITGALKPQDLEKAMLADVDVKPVGQEYIEEEKDATGRFANFVCKLCDCKFSDKGAKDVHLKGRRHRLQYKQKVDPSLKVEVKQQWGAKKHAAGQHQRFGAYTGPTFLPPPQQPRPLMPMQRNHEMMDDKHVLHKLHQIQLSMDQVREVERLAAFVEKTLKAVSDSLMTTVGGGGDNGTETPGGGDGNGADVALQQQQQPEEQRMLKGVMRVGLLAKHLLLKVDKKFDMVVLCLKLPTVTLLKQVADSFEKNAETLPDGEQLTVTVLVEDSALDISLSTVPFCCRVTLTCVQLRETLPPKTTPAADGGGGPVVAASQVEEEIPPADLLPKGPCLNALAELRHAKFYQVKCTPLHSLNSTVKIVRDIGNRVRTWSAMSNWAIELLVEKTLASVAMPLSPGDGVRRVFEVISSGQFLSKRSKLFDPCEKEPLDVLAHISDQEREDITSSAQHALRLIAYKQLYKILGVERLPDARAVLPLLQAAGAKKPKLESEDENVDNVKTANESNQMEGTQQ